MHKACLAGPPPCQVKATSSQWPPHAPVSSWQRNLSRVQLHELPNYTPFCLAVHIYNVGRCARVHMEVILRAGLGLGTAFCRFGLHFPEVYRMYFFKITSFLQLENPQNAEPPYRVWSAGPTIIDYTSWICWGEGIVLGWMPGCQRCLGASLIQTL